MQGVRKKAMRHNKTQKTSDAMKYNTKNERCDEIQHKKRAMRHNTTQAILLHISDYVFLFIFKI